MHTAERTAADWFTEAQRSYAEKHQGCPWCNGQHRVHRVVQGAKIKFVCQRCDFQVYFDAQTKRYQFIRGEPLSEVSETMLGYPIYQDAPSN